MGKDKRFELIFKGGCNQYEDGTTRTIKSQYGQTSVANFEYQGTFGASGVIEVWKLKSKNSDG